MGLLDEKVILVTGAGGGIGRAHALACGRAGARVVVNDLGGDRHGVGSSTAADAVVDELRVAGVDAIANDDSVTDEAGCARMVQAALDRWGRLDGVINNAGILRDKSFRKMSREAWDIVLSVHLDGTRNVCAAALPALEASRGSIVNTTSISGMLGKNFGQSNYAAAKAGIYALTRVLAVELERSGVRANCIAPVAWTRMTEDLGGRVPEHWSADHVAPVAVYLLSDLARELTGQVFGVHGPHLFTYEVHMSEGVRREDEGIWSPEEIAASLDAIRAFPAPAEGSA